MTRILMIRLPWTDHEDRRQFAMMRVKGPRSRKEIFGDIRQWYKEQIGVDVTTSTIATLWQCRFETTAMDEQKMHAMFDEMINRMAHESLKEVTDTDTEDEATTTAGV